MIISNSLGIEFNNSYLPKISSTIVTVNEYSVQGTTVSNTISNIRSSVVSPSSTVVTPNVSVTLSGSNSQYSFDSTNSINQIKISDRSTVISEIIIPKSTLEPKLNLSTILDTLSDESKMVTITSQLDIDSATNQIELDVVIPDNTEISGNENWTGEFLLPTQKAISSIIGNNLGTIDSVIEIGSESGDLTLSKPAKLTFNTK